jgi:LemA protein
MKPLQFLAIFFIGLLVIAVLGGGCIYSGYNRAIAMDETVKNSWSEIDNLLQRRWALNPNLVNTVKGITAQEQAVFLGIANARKAYFQTDNVADKGKAASQVESGLSRLLLLQESYPALKSNEAFLKLQDQLEGTENRLSVARQRYNDSVKDLNTMVRQFPGTFYARLAGVKEAEYFQIDNEAKTAPKVDFSPPKTDTK